jgi:transcriptional regulator GlxA family with amidase domain
MEEAYRLLIQTELPIQEIAERTGYSILQVSLQPIEKPLRLRPDQSQKKKNGSIQDRRLSGNLTRFYY